MKNEPENWQSQTWTIPRGMLKLSREGNKWYLRDFTGQVQIEVENLMGIRMIIAWNEAQEEEDWIDRHSLQFRWLRFWYRRKQRREERASRGTIQST